MFLLVVFGLPVAEIELREEKVSEETICILKTRGLFEKEVLHGVLRKPPSEATVKRSVDNS